MSPQEYSEYFAKLEEDMAQTLWDAMIVEFRPKVWTRWIVLAYMSLPDPSPDFEIAAYSYFARNFHSQPVLPIQEKI